MDRFSLEYRDRRVIYRQREYSTGVELRLGEIGVEIEPGREKERKVNLNSSFLSSLSLPSLVSP